MAQQLKSNQSRLQHQSLLQSQSQAQQQQPCSVSLKINKLFRLEWHVMSLDCSAATANRFKLLQKMLRMSWLWECKTSESMTGLAFLIFNLRRRKSERSEREFSTVEAGRWSKRAKRRFYFSSPLPCHLSRFTLKSSSFAILSERTTNKNRRK